MSILIKSAKIIDASSKFNGKTKDIFINQGIIQEISDSIVKKSDKEINYDNLHVSQGWLDTSVCFGEPGLEERETIENGIQELEEALKGDDKEAIDAKVKTLSEASAPLAQRMYEEEAKNNEASQQDAQNSDSDVVDADFEEVTEEKEKQNS